MFFSLLLVTNSIARKWECECSPEAAEIDNCPVLKDMRIDYVHVQDASASFSDNKVQVADQLLRVTTDLHDTFEEVRYGLSSFIDDEEHTRRLLDNGLLRSVSNELFCYKQDIDLDARQPQDIYDALVQMKNIGNYDNQESVLKALAFSVLPDGDFSWNDYTELPVLRIVTSATDNASKMKDSSYPNFETEWFNNRECYSEVNQPDHKDLIANQQGEEFRYVFLTAGEQNGAKSFWSGFASDMRSEGIDAQYLDADSLSELSEQIMTGIMRSACARPPTTTITTTTTTTNTTTTDKNTNTISVPSVSGGDDSTTAPEENNNAIYIGVGAAAGAAALGIAGFFGAQSVGLIGGGGASEISGTDDQTGAAIEIVDREGFVPVVEDHFM